MTQESGGTVRDTKKIWVTLTGLPLTVKPRTPRLAWR